MRALHQDLNRTNREPNQELPEKTRLFLNTMRLVGRRCRAKARQDLFEACATLSTDKTASAVAFAETLIRCLSQSLGKPPVLFRPGEQDVSFDEAWLLQLAASVAKDDQASTAFLLRSRIQPHARRQCAFLVRSVVDRFEIV